MNVHQKPRAGISLEVDLSVRPESYYYYYYYYCQSIVQLPIATVKALCNWQLQLSKHCATANFNCQLQPQLPTATVKTLCNYQSILIEVSIGIGHLRRSVNSVARRRGDQLARPN